MKLSEHRESLVEVVTPYQRRISQLEAELIEERKIVEHYTHKYEDSLAELAEARRQLGSLKEFTVDKIRAYIQSLGQATEVEIWGQDIVQWLIDEHTEARRENERLREIKLFCHAEAQTLCDGRDFSLAAYMLKDLEITQSAGLVDLCYAMSKETASKGDWEGLKTLWLECALKSGDDDDMA